MKVTVQETGMHAIPTPPFTHQLTLEALEQAVRWPHPDRQAVVSLVGQFLATHRDWDGFAYFSERARAQPDEPLFQALEGLFQARLTDSQSLIHRLRWLNDAIAKLDRAVTQAPGLTTYFRGLVLAEAPGLLRRADAAVADLEWVLANRSGAHRIGALWLSVLERRRAPIRHRRLDDGRRRVPFRPAQTGRDGAADLRRPGLRLRRLRFRADRRRYRGNRRRFHRSP